MLKWGSGGAMLKWGNGGTILTRECQNMKGCAKVPLSSTKRSTLSARIQTSAVRIQRLTVIAMAVSKRYVIPAHRNLDLADTLDYLLFFSFI
jgi:hypothetical protein